MGTFWFEDAEDGADCSHDVHAVGGFGEMFQNSFEDIGNSSHSGHSGLQGGEFLLGGKFVVEEQVEDLFEDAVFGQVVDVVAPIVESKSQSNCGDGAVSSDDPVESLVRFGRF